VTAGGVGGLPVHRFLDALAGPDATPGGGPAAAVAVALGVALAGMSARLSPGHLDGAASLAAGADRLRRAALDLADEDMAAYEAVRAARDSEAARRRATEAPLAIARVGADVVTLAARLVEGGNPNLAGDALTGGLVALAGVRAAAALVALNVRGWGLDSRLLDEAESCARAAARALDRAQPDATRRA